MEVRRWRLDTQVETVAYMYLELRAEASRADSVACAGEMIGIEVVGPC